MKWLKKTAVVSCAIGVLASFAAMLPTSHSTEAAIAVFDAKNIEEAIKIAIQTAKILTEEQKQLALQIFKRKNPPTTAEGLFLPIATVRRVFFWLFFFHTNLNGIVCYILLGVLLVEKTVPKSIVESAYDLVELIIVEFFQFGIDFFEVFIACCYCYQSPFCFQSFIRLKFLFVTSLLDFFLLVK